MRIDERWPARAENTALWCLAGTLAAASFSNSFFEIFSSVFMCLTALLVITRRDLKAFQTPWVFFVGLFLAINLVSMALSVDLWSSAKGAFRVFRCILLALSTFYILNSRERFCRAYDVFAWVVLLAGLDALIQGFVGFDPIRGHTMTPYSSEVGRVTGPFHHANDFAAFLSLGFFLCAALLPYALKRLSVRAKILYISSSIVSFFCLLWTFARGAWVAVILALITTAVWRKNWRIIVSIPLLLVALFFLSPAALKTRVRSFVDLADGTMKERRLLWGESVRMIQDRPWLGFGPNTYARVEPQYKPKDSRTDYQYAHNGYLQMAAEIGLLGLGSFLLLLALFFTRVLPSFIAERSTELGARGLALAGGILSFLFHSATDTNLQSLRLVGLLWIALGLGLAAHRSLRGAGR